MKSEFQFLADLKSRYHLNQIGDDCAVLPMSDTHDLLVTADMLVEDIDFRLAWTTPEFLGYKALAVSLSDIAAMGGTAKWALLSIGVPERLWETDFLDRFYLGWHDLAREHDVELVGGDISRVEQGLVIDSTAGGKVIKGQAIKRGGATGGDAIFVSGFLGGAVAGLGLLENDQRFYRRAPPVTRHLLLRQLQPIPQIKTGIILREHHLATSMIDLSDGLSSDLTHILNASRVGDAPCRRRHPDQPCDRRFSTG